MEFNSAFDMDSWLKNAHCFLSSANVKTITLGNSPSTLGYEYHFNNLNYGKETDVLQGFISNLIENIEDLDGRIVDMVNDNFWDLI